MVAVLADIQDSVPTLVPVDVQTSVLSSVLCSANGGGSSLPTAEKVECFPLACVQVDTPFYSGDLVCCVIDDPVLLSLIHI